MNIEKIKYVISNHIGDTINFRYNGSRNQIEEFSGVVLSSYPAVFTIELSSGLVRSFAYTDILIGNLEICL